MLLLCRRQQVLGAGPHRPCAAPHVPLPAVAQPRCTGISISSISRQRAASDGRAGAADAAPTSLPEERGGMLPAFVLLACCSVLLGAPSGGFAAAAPQPSVVQGPARVVDGDTLVVGGERIRLLGIDSPEKAQNCTGGTGQPYACGLVSKDLLEKEVGNKAVTCTLEKRDRYGRGLGLCSLVGAPGGANSSLNAWMVEQGLAVAYREYSKAFVGEEGRALRAHRGIWVLGGSLEYPAEWRRHERQGGAHTAAPYVPPPGEGAEGRQQAVAATAAAGARGVAAEPGTGCGGGGLRVKGNVGAGGERIYHVPGSKYYDRVRIDADKGERCFASASEAELAGFRRAGG